jgi:tryptophan synthase alpha chain
MPSNCQTRDRYGDMFQQLKQEGRHAVIPFTLLGWPNPEVCLKTIDAFVAGGATALELGLAFSDPMADGLVIQLAAKEVLDAQFKVDAALALLAKIRERHPDIPIGLLVYYNLVLARGIEKFFQDVATAGADGVLIADLPVETSNEVLPAAKTNGVHLIGMVSPITDETRLKQILQASGGFLYVVSRLGITGTEERYAQSLSDLLKRIKAHSNIPACIGFGISQPKHVKNMLELGADGVIIGSAVIERIRQSAPAYETNGLRDYLQTLATVK